MSKIVTATVEDLASGDTVPTKYVVHGSAKAWANLNGTGTIALRGSFNVSSVTDNGTGQYTFTYTAAMVNTNYRAQTDVGNENSTYSVCPQEAHPLTTSSARAVFIGVISTAVNDVSVVGFGVDGDLA
jgi:hypothetical protein